MKFSTRLAAIALSLCAAFAFVACDDDDSDKTLPVSDATVEVTTVSKTSESAVLSITTSAADAAAYYRTTDVDFVATGEFVFRNGVQIEPNQTVSISMPYLESMADYRVITAARASNGGYTVVYTDIHVPDYPASIEISVDKIKPQAVVATFTPDEHAKSYKVGIGRSSSTVEEFLADEISTLTISGNSPNTLDLAGLSPEEDYVIYAVSFNSEGPCDVTTAAVRTSVAPSAAIEVTMDNVIIADVKVTPNDATSKYIYIAASAEIWDEYAEAFGGEVALIETFYSFGQAIMDEGVSESQWELNGECSYEYLIACLVYDEDGEAYGVVKQFFTSPDRVENAPQASLEITVGEVTSTSARLIYTMSGGTLGYYQGIFTESEYLDMLTSRGEDYIRQYVAFYGYMMLEDDDYVWPGLTAGTNYVAVGSPFNVNGIEEYGPLATAEFTTADGTSSAAAGAFGKRNSNAHRGLISAEQLDAIGR